MDNKKLTQGEISKLFEMFCYCRDCGSELKIEDIRNGVDSCCSSKEDE